MAGEQVPSGDARRTWRAVIAEIGSAYAGATIEGFRKHGTAEDQQRQQFVLASIEEYCGTMPTCITFGVPVVFLGTCGTGKDHLMVGMIRRAIQAGCYSIRWVDAVEMFGEFKDAVSQHVPLAEVLQPYIDPQLLVISDGLPVNEALSPFEQEMLFRVINGRQRRLKTNWVNFNVADRTEAAEKIGEKILSRLGHNALTLRLQWADYRRIAN